MSNGIWSAASGAVGQQLMLEVAANNLANASTPAYRGDRAVFAQRMIDAERAGGAREFQRFTTTNTTAADTSQGAIEETGKPLDVALEGPGFFVVDTAQGERYTRNGAFRRGADGTLLSSGGEPVLGEGRTPLQIDPKQDVTIGADGTVFAGEDEVGKLLVVSFQNPDALVKTGLTLYEAVPGAGAPEAADTAVMSGALERSNVSVVKGMADLVTATRSFEALQRVIDTFSETERRAAMGIMGNR